MLRISSVWRGAIDEAYRSQAEAWVKENLEDPDNTVIEYINLSDYNAKRITEEGLEALKLGGEYYELFPTERALFIQNVNDWDAKLVGKLINYLQKMESPLVVAFTNTKDAAAIKAVKDAVDEDFDYVIPKENPEFGEWIVSYFERSGASISKQDAFKLAEFAGESRELAVSVARSALVGNLGRAITWKDDISKIVSKMGMVAPYKVTGAIAKGDIGQSVEILTRVLDGGIDALAVLGLIRKRYQSYLTALRYSNSQSFVKEFGGNPFAAKYLYSESQSLGQVRIARSLEMIRISDGDLKGGLTGMPRAAMIELLVIGLANQFRLANRR